MQDYPTRRDALPGELCTCGRQAREVILTTDHREVGYCGIPDGGDKTGPCPFCGGKRHESGACPQYQVRPPATAWDRHDDPEQQPDKQSPDGEQSDKPSSE